MLKDRIDIVLPWVDSTDPLWLAEYEKYLSTSANGDSRMIRYRDWGLLNYWFRGIEQFMPWINKVYFVSAGHVPKWLNLSHPKIEWVKHEEFIPKQYLPTFNINTIELNLHRINGLSDTFIYFNDDVFILRSLSSRRFFKNGLPCDLGVMTAKPSDGGVIHMAINNLDLIDRNFNKHKQIKRLWHKWFSISYGKGILNNLLLLPWRDFSGFIDPHLPNAFLKSTFEEVWLKEGSELDKTCMSRFRNNDNLNQWLFRYWQLAQGKFMPTNTKRNAVCMDISDESVDKIIHLIENGKLDMICLNDSSEIKNIEQTKVLLQESLNKILPKKSSFEI